MRTQAHHHGPGCGHMAIRHGQHIDYVADNGRLEHDEQGHLETHSLEVSETNPNRCQPVASAGHIHRPGCGHEPLAHGDHIDYVVAGRLEHPHGDHNDDHGEVEIVPVSQGI